MSRQVQAIFSLLLVAACAATVVAHAPPPTPASPPPPPSPTIPGLLLPPGIPSLLPPGFPGLFPPGTPGLFPPGIPGNPADIAKCWSSLQNVPGCAIEISTSIFTGRFGLGPACCKAFQTIDDNCLNKMFPLLPLLPPLLKSQCGKVNGAAP